MNKYAVISFTPEDDYAFFAPIAFWCWKKLGIGCQFIIPRRMVDTHKLNLILKYTQGAFYQMFTSPDYKEATYAQVSRLYAADEDDTVFIISDVDMAVFRDVFTVDDYFNILGADLVPPEQYPMCYAWAKGEVWQKVMDLRYGAQEHLDLELGPIECDHFRGCQWSYDQSLLYRRASMFQPVAIKHRARPGTQFASQRADRSDINWRAYTGPTLLDAHLWRPGYTDENFGLIIELLQIQYPDEDLNWLVEYRNQYIGLLQQHTQPAQPPQSTQPIQS